MFMLTLPQSSRAPTVGDRLNGVDSGPSFLGLAGEMSCTLILVRDSGIQKEWYDRVGSGML